MSRSTVYVETITPIADTGLVTPVGLPDNPSAHIEEPHAEFGTIGHVSMTWRRPGIYWSGSEGNVVSEEAAKVAGWNTDQYRFRKMIVDTLRRNGSPWRA